MEFTSETLALGLIWYVAFLFSLTVHEAAHAWAALKLGDPTAYQGGQVTLNPLPHMQREPFGTILVPLLSFFMAGWMMGWASAPYDPVWAARHPKRAGLMALAGPVSNLIIFVLAALGLRIGLSQGVFAPATAEHVGRLQFVQGATEGGAEGAAMLLSVLFALNLLLFLFNLLPLPPLDGASVIQLVMSEEMAVKYRGFIAQPMFALLGLVIAWRLLGTIFWPILIVALQVVYF